MHIRHSLSPAGGNQQAVPLTVTNETNVLDTVTNGMLAGCYVVRISLVPPGTISYVGSPAYAGIRAGNPPWNKCSDVSGGGLAG